MALANYGPTAALFTLGPNHTVQQYDTSPPALVKTAHYFPMLAPTASQQNTPKTNQQESHLAAIPRAYDLGKGPSTLSTIQRAAKEIQDIELARRLRENAQSPVSSLSRTESVSSRSSADPHHQRSDISVSSRAASGTTFSTFSPSMAARDSMVSGNSSLLHHRASSVASSGRRSKNSRLRQEILLSPENAVIRDLFPYTRARIGRMPYTQPQVLSQTDLSADDLRKKMLMVVFGWEGDIEPLIRDELSHHPPGSMHAVLLSKWLGDVDVDMMASGSISSADWMLLAFSQMGQQASTNKLGQAFVQRLLQQGDIHTSATILLGMGDRDQAIDIYVSRNLYMEAILLTCLLFPSDWQRHAQLVRRWGEYVVENSQQHLAMRCFSATGADPSMAWASPTLGSALNGQSPPQNVHPVLSPPTSPPSANSQPGVTRKTTKNSSLKLITSFEGPDQPHFKFPGLKSEDRTPTNAPGVTPIAESAISPGGTPNTYLRPHTRGKGNLTVRTATPGGYNRNRLSSIGETPIDVIPPLRPSALPTPNDSGSDKEKDFKSGTEASDSNEDKKSAEAPLLLSSAKYDPGTVTPRDTPQTAVPSSEIGKPVLSSIPQDKFIAIREGSRQRNGSRDRKPDGLHIHMPTLQQLNLNAYATSATDATPRIEHRRSNTWSLQHSTGELSSRYDSRSETRSPPGTGQSWTSSTKSPGTAGRSIDQYISSLEEASFRSRKQKTEPRRADRSRDGRTPAGESGEHKSRSKNRHKDASEDRGRGGQRYIRPPKRSPSSPVPMSPADLQQYRDTNNQSLDTEFTRGSSPEPTVTHSRGHSSKRKGVSKQRSNSKTSDYSHRTVRRISPSGFVDSQLGSEASYDTRSKVSSRRPSPEGLLDPTGRGRSISKIGSALRSPSSPLPMSPEAKYYQGSDDEDDPLRIVEANRQRLRSQQRSTSRRPRDRGALTPRDPSPDRRVPSRNQHYREARNSDPSQRHLSTDQRISDGEKVESDGNKSDRALKKELAARELEARRESLVRRPSAPSIPLPSELTATRPAAGDRSQTDLSNNPTSWGGDLLPTRQYHATSNSPAPSPIEPRSATVGPYGLPATPRAMRHPKYGSRDEGDIPAVPELPENIEPLSERYLGNQSMRELPRSMSAPIPEPNLPPIPSEMPTHPAFHKALRSNKRPNFAPLGEIGQHRRNKGSVDGQSGSMAPPVIVSIDETLHLAESPTTVPVIDNPPLLPELQHLSSAVPPPPPPPPVYRNDSVGHNSVSSGSGVGVISIVMDDQSRSGTPVIEVPASTHGVATSPPPAARATPPVFPGAGHRRGRSINENIGSRFKGITDRMRSTSRGRNNNKSPPPVQLDAPAPYESVPPMYF